MEQEMGRTEDFSAQEQARRSDDSFAGAVALGSLDDFEVAEDFPDPRGWDVSLSDGLKIGKVHELLVDTAALRTRYLQIALDRDQIGIPEKRNVLIPVGVARLDDNRDEVILDGIDLTRLSALPPFDSERLSASDENRIMSAFTFNDERFYGSRFRGKSRQNLEDKEARVTRSEEELAIGKRRVQAGEVNVQKRIETEHVTEPVSVRREEVTVERRPVSDAHTAGAVDIGEDQIRVPVTEEELIVEKRPVVKEEVVIRKHAIQDTEQVEADVRKERVEVNDTRKTNDTRNTNDIDRPDNLSR